MKKNFLFLSPPVQAPSKRLKELDITSSNNYFEKFLVKKKLNYKEPVKEEDYIYDRSNHYKNFKSTLSQISDDHLDDGLQLLDKNLDNVINSIAEPVLYKRKPACFFNKDSLSGSQKNLVEDFIDDTTLVADKIVLKESLTVLFKKQLQEDSTLNKYTMEVYRNEGYCFNGHIADHPFHEEFLNRVVSELSRDDLPYIRDLVCYTETSEFFTGVCLDDKFALIVGAKAFIQIYGVLKTPGNFRYFLYEARDTLYWKTSILSTIRIHKPTVIFVLSPLGLGIGGFIKTAILKAAPAAISKAAVIIPSTPAGLLSLKGIAYGGAALFSGLFSYIAATLTAEAFQGAIAYRVYGAGFDKAPEILKAIIKAIKK